MPAMIGIVAIASFAAIVAGQHPGPEGDVHPPLTTWECTKQDGCVARNTYVVMDSLSHPVYQIDNPSKNCGEWGEPADPEVCPDEETCQAQCRMDGVSNYAEFGIETDGDELLLRQLVNGKLASPRVYLLDEAKENYAMLSVTGGEFAFDVDMSKLPCGMNSAVCFMEMEADGGLGGLNTAGAPWGTGYCDAQCFTTPFINGLPNLDGKGACCNEMDIWEANMRATSIAPHTCNKPGIFTCEGEECDYEGNCDEYGCMLHPFRNGDPNFYGAGEEFTVNTLKPFTIVTQFPVNEDGTMTAIKRLYVQDGKVIQMPTSDIEGVPDLNYPTDEWCDALDVNRYTALGGMKGMGDSMARGVVLVMSLWWDTTGFMKWLDSGNRGPCNATEGDPAVIVQKEPDPTVTYSNIRWGEIDSTYQKCSKRRT